MTRPPKNPRSAVQLGFVDKTDILLTKPVQPLHRISAVVHSQTFCEGFAGISKGSRPAIAGAPDELEAAWEGSKLIMTEPAKPSSDPAHSAAGTASPATVHSRGVKMMEARIRKAPFAIVVNMNP